mmetsp:Transcript_6695/g.10976  ORF Transcript_6695/g.10976 Transcript_6695/m.10976 type:complete len:221 (-) Transcript_6695:1609-2271(-)
MRQGTGKHNVSASEHIVPVIFFKIIELSSSDHNRILGSIATLVSLQVHVVQGSQTTLGRGVQDANLSSDGASSQGMISGNHDDSDTSLMAASHSRWDLITRRIFKRKHTNKSKVFDGEVESITLLGISLKLESMGDIRKQKLGEGQHTLSILGNLGIGILDFRNDLGSDGFVSSMDGASLKNTFRGTLDDNTMSTSLHLVNGSHPFSGRAEGNAANFFEV